jgi:type I restriction enzyme M protein
MDQATHNKIVSFIWGIADDVLRDLFKRGKYPDVILPMCVIRRMDAVLEPTKKKVLETKKMLDDGAHHRAARALCDAAGQAFYNTSKFTLRDLKSRGSQQQLLADFEDYLNGFSPNVQDILENFKFRNQLPTLSKADAIGTLINKFLDPDIDLSPAGIDNHSMGTVFEELVRKFNEDNNEEAGEHWTPRDAVRLMANLVFLPIESEIKSGTYLLYDCACGTGGMLTVAEETLTAIAAKRGQQVKCLLYGQEINPETYAVCKADMLLKGEGESADHIVGGAEWSTLAHDAFPAQEFDFMLANPPYGKSWKKDLEAMGGKDGMRDPRFKVMHEGEELSLVTRSSDGQMLFLANMASKMNGSRPWAAASPRCTTAVALHRRRRPGREQHPPLAHRERLARGHRRAAPQPLLQHRHRHLRLGAVQPQARAPQGQVQLIDASQWFKPLRKNLGKKNCELSPEDIERINRTFLDFVGNARVEDLPQRRLRLLEGDGRAPAAPAQPAFVEGHRVAALRLGRRGHPRRAVARSSATTLFTDFARGRAGAAPRRVGQRRRRGRRRGGGGTGRACPRRSARSCSIPPRPGSATAAWSRSPPGCARRWATRSSRTTTSSAIAWTRARRRRASSCPPPTSSRS